MAVGTAALGLPVGVGSGLEDEELAELLADELSPLTALLLDTKDAVALLWLTPSALAPDV